MSGNNWERVLLDSVATRGSGHTPDKKNAAYWGGTVKWVSLKDSGDLDSGAIASTAETTTSAGLSNSSAVLHSKGTVILLRDASVGKSAVLDDHMAVSQHFIAWNCGAQLNNWYLYYVLQAMKTEFQRIANGNTIGTIGLRYFRNLTIPLPGRGSQDAIAEVLYDTDELISSLERLIAKKQAIKRGMMQQLLTGRTRLPGFTDEWRSNPLAELATVASGGTPDAGNRSYYGGGIPWVSISDITSAGRYISTTANTLTNAGLKYSTAKLYEPGVVLFAMYASLGECSIARGRVSSSQAILGIAPDRLLDRDFLYYYLCSIKPMVKTMGQQGAQTNINARMVKSIAVSLPSISEQVNIARVLRDGDDEIDALRARLDKARAVKQGMMRELLTGRTRLRPRDAA